MLRLKDRTRQIPGGLKFYLPELKWKSPANYPSFRVICDALEHLIRANPYPAQQHKWPTDRVAIEDWVDLYNATLCAKMGWTDYIMPGEGGGQFPKSQPLPQNVQSLGAVAARARELVAGAKTLTEWIDSNEPPVPRDLAQQRAEICAHCFQNEAGDLTAWFTVPAAELIKRQVEKAQARDLSTIHDAKLNLCVACHCPLKLKVHVPLPWITKRLTAEQKTRLKQAPACWILNEAQ